MEKIKPCPFCGGKAEMITYGTLNQNGVVGFSFKIVCTKCNLKLPDTSYVEFKLERDGEIKPINDDRASVIAKWNERH